MSKKKKEKKCNRIRIDSGNCQVERKYRELYHTYTAYVGRERERDSGDKRKYSFFSQRKETFVPCAENLACFLVPQILQSLFEEHDFLQD